MGYIYNLGTIMNQNAIKFYGSRILIGVAIAIFILLEADGVGDFNIFLSASRDLFLGKNIYTISYNDWYHYYYDLFFAIALSPLTALPLYWAKVVWLSLNIFFLWRIWTIISSWLPIQIFDKNKRKIFAIACLIFSLEFIKANFHLAQVSIFILYLAMEALYFINSNGKITGSVFLAWGIVIKLLPIVLLPWLLYKKEWKAFTFTIAFIVLLLFLPSVFIGTQQNNFLLSERWKSINPNNKEHIMDAHERSFYSLTTLLTTLLVKETGDSHALLLKRNIADISVKQLSLVINIVRTFFILLTLWFLRRFGFDPENKIKRFYEISYLLLAAPLIFPHQQFYAFFFAFPATVYILFYFQNRYITGLKENKRNKIIMASVLVSIYILTNSHLILGTYRDIYDHFKTLTYGILLLTILLAFCTPDKLILEKEKV
jgi:hypothetical protein